MISGFLYLVICDEERDRTTGVTISGEDEGEGTPVRYMMKKFIKAKKRMHTTATPRILSDDAQTRAALGICYAMLMDYQPIRRGNIPRGFW